MPNNYFLGVGENDPYWHLVKLYMDMMAPPGSVALIDRKGHAVVSSAPASATQARFSPTSAKHTTNATYIEITDTADFAINNGEFTIDGDIWVDSILALGCTILGRWNITNGLLATNDFLVHITPAGAVGFMGYGITFYSADGVFKTKQWNLISVERWGNILNIFLNGVKVATHTLGMGALASIGRSGKNLRTSRWDSATSGYNGYSGILRLTIGAARYKGENHMIPSRIYPIH